MHRAAAMIVISLTSFPARADSPEGAKLAVQIISRTREPEAAWIRQKDDQDHFHVLVRNLTKEPINVWEEGCSLGWGNLSFIVSPSSGPPFFITRSGRVWSGNVPTPHTVWPDEPYIRDVNLFDGSWETNGKVLTRGGFPREARLKAVFKIPNGDPAGIHKSMLAKWNIWQGSIESPEGLYHFELGYRRVERAK